MIPRYTRPEMAAIWEAETKYGIWLEIEAHACDAMAELGIIPAEAAKAVRQRGRSKKVWEEIWAEVDNGNLLSS